MGIITRFLELIEGFFLKTIVKGCILPFLTNPVKRLLAGGGVLLLLILALRGEIGAGDILNFITNQNFIVFILILLIAEVLNIVLDKSSAPGRKRKSS